MALAPHLPIPPCSSTLRAASFALRLGLLVDFVVEPYGAAYGVGRRDRVRMAAAFQRTLRALPAGTTVLSQIALAREILSLPPSLPGDLVECGAWKGASAACLSRVAAAVGRRLVICDSFAGLPDEGRRLYLSRHTGSYGYLAEGLFAGGMSEVQSALGAYGRPEVCEFVPGFFSESLRNWSRLIAFAFLDVDLPSSFHDCLRALWPYLSEGGAFYVDDVRCMEVAQVFFDKVWWQTELGCPAPGLIGSGCGLPISIYASNIGYVRKWPPFDPKNWRREADF